MSTQKYFGLTIEQLRVRVGLLATDATKDTLIDQAFAGALDAIEVYLDRKLTLDVYTETLTHFFGAVASLRAYPLAMDPLTYEPVVSIQEAGMALPFHADVETGLVHFDGYIRRHAIKIDYTGGYDTLPSGLMIAMLMAFDVMWSSVNGGGAVGSGVVSRITVPDVGTISYSTGGGGGVTGYNDVGLLPSTVVSMLEPYRRRLV